MTLPIERLIEAARIRGLTQSNGILLTIDGPNSLRVNVTVSYQEPIHVVAPMDVIWIHPETATTLRRRNRAKSTQFEHTWDLVTEANFWRAQIWDEPRPKDQDLQELNRNIGNTHLLKTSDIGAISDTGADMKGPLRPRVVENDAYDATEVVPRSFVEKLTATAQSVASSVAQQLVSVRSLLTNARNRLTIVENKLKDIQVGEGTPRYKHDQIEEALEWIVAHALETLDVTVEIRNAEGVLMIPDIQIPIDKNTIKLTFAEPRVGYAYIIGIR